MKRIVLLLILTINCGVCLAQQILVKTINGEEYHIDMEKSPIITIADESLMIKDKTTAISIPLVKVAKYTIVQSSDVSGIENGVTEMDNNSAPFMYKDNKIIFGPAEKIRMVNIYTLKGSLLKQFAIQPGAGGYFDTTALQPDVYIVEVDGLTLKILKR